MQWSVVPWRLCSSGWENLRRCKLVLYYVEFVQAHATKTLTKKVSDGGLIRGVGLTRQCVEDLNTSSPPFTQIRFFFFFHRSSSRSCYHIATTARGSPPQPMQEGRLQPHLGAREPPRRRYLFPLAPTPTAAATACIRRYASKVIFFFSFFLFFSDHCRDLFSPHARSSNPHLSTVPRPSSLASPAAAIASFVGTQVKICFFFFFSFLF